MVPRTVEFREELPKTASGKIARRLLVEPDAPPLAPATGPAAKTGD
jgi:acyl-coenzyme A synthetase/AMP-(fatty) acid ligase